jgi:hypothetical protein
MRSFPIIGPHPIGCLILNLRERSEQVEVKNFLTVRLVKSFYKGVLSGLTVSGVLNLFEMNSGRVC